RRHTRWPRDWSSDVCSSDLVADEALDPVMEARVGNHRRVSGEDGAKLLTELGADFVLVGAGLLGRQAQGALEPADLLVGLGGLEIGRASRREGAGVRARGVA